MTGTVGHAASMRSSRERVQASLARRHASRLGYGSVCGRYASVAVTPASCATWSACSLVYVPSARNVKSYRTNSGATTIGPPGPSPHRVQVLGCHYTERPQHVDQTHVAPLAAQLHRIPRRLHGSWLPRVQTTFASRSLGSRTAHDVVEILADVPGDQQPVVVRLRAQTLDDAAVLAVGDIQVADGVQVHAGNPEPRRPFFPISYICAPRWRTTGTSRPRPIHCSVSARAHAWQRPQQAHPDTLCGGGDDGVHVAPARQSSTAAPCRSCDRNQPRAPRQWRAQRSTPSSTHATDKLEAALDNQPPDRCAGGALVVARPSWSRPGSCTRAASRTAMTVANGTATQACSSPRPLLLSSHSGRPPA